MVSDIGRNRRAKLHRCEVTRHQCGQARCALHRERQDRCPLVHRWGWATGTGLGRARWPAARSLGGAGRRAGARAGADRVRTRRRLPDRVRIARDALSSSRTRRVGDSPTRVGEAPAGHAHSGPGTLRYTQFRPSELAVTISGIPFLGPIAGARVGYVDGAYVLNPLIDDMASSDLDLIVAGTADAVLMVESEASELSEDVMLGAVMFGQEQFQPVLKMIIELAEECAKEPWALPEEEDHSKTAAKLEEVIGADLRAAYEEKVKQPRTVLLAAAREKAAAAFENDEELGPNVVKDLVKSMEKHIVRRQVLDTGVRIDGRDTKTVREIVAETDVLPRTHGSALFTRGETQALVVTTLGTGQDEQIVDALDGEYREHFMLHYNFPPYSVGETKFMASPGRREIGHGKLAWRALHALMPDRETFPYTIRVVSEVTESNGSSSMATVCGSSLSMMGAGVPLKAACAGIAMGLILEDDGYAVLSDILGDEDHLGDMDFKVAGTEDGITALQMDIKVTGITREIMQAALDQAHEGRKHILREMAKALSSSRSSVAEYAPRITTITIPKDKIREVIGTGGKVIREICETTGAKIDIEDDGTIKVASADTAAGEAAIKWIKDIVAEPEIGVIYKGKVVKVVDFGAFVNFIGSKDGLVHISELAPRRVGKVTDIVNEGDEVWVKVLSFDDRGKVRLSMKMIDQETGKEKNAAQETKVEAEATT
ncbi:MAG: polyribonucleotide nucleotidyltransferase [Proteobacteria bacterium]|nr:polyribonucleotide nucleotidyltransferase [Pseudomonadota bacterium]